MLHYRMAENIILAIAFFTLTLAGLTSPRGLHYNTDTTPSCYGLKSKHEFSNFSVGQIIPSDGHLNICVNNGTTCCTRRLEQRLHKLSQDNVRNIQEAKTDLIKKIFGEGAIKLQEFFEDHIDSSERELDQEFTRVYRKAYANNSYLTKSFYYKLRKHYKNGEYKISKIVHEFFTEVLKKMYLLLNRGVSTDVDMDCVGSTYHKLEPFGRVPRELIPRLERSITAARTMIYGLLSGKSVVEKLSDDRWFSEKCFNSVTKMSQCSVCAGYSNLKPCVGHCISVYGECLFLLTELENDWDDYIFYLSSLGYQLDGSYDFEAVTGELPYDISSGIMNCQRALLSKLLPKITQLCKKSKVRTQRSVISSDNNDFFLENNERVQRSLETSRRQPRFTLGKLLEQYQKHFEKLKKFWSNLPNAMCDETVVANNATRYCWDGFKITNNTPSVQQGYLNKTRKNGQNDVTIVSLISQLQTTIKNLKAAVDGKTVNPPTIPGTESDYSGSASGSGSGADIDEVNKEDEGIILNEVPEEKTELPKPADPDDNSVDINVLEERPDVKSRETGRGRASYVHTCVVLLLTSLLVHLV